MKKIIFVLIALFAFGIGNAQFGQSSGILDFGVLNKGESKVLSYWLVNTGDKPIDFQIIADKNVEVYPKNGTIRPGGQVKIFVSVHAEKEGEFKGSIIAKAIENTTGAVVFNIQLEKDYKYVVKEKNSNLLLLAGLVIFLIIVLLYLIKKRR